MKAKKRYIIIAVLAAILIGGFSAYNYMYKAHRNIASERVDFELETLALKKFMSNASEAITYTDKVIQTSGKITSIEHNSVILDDMIQVNFSAENLNTLSTEKQVIVKGRCVGYDDLLELVKIDQATLINN